MGRMWYAKPGEEVPGRKGGEELGIWQAMSSMIREW